MKDTAQYRALVVDDEAIVRQATIRALSRAGFNCEAAQDGRIALEMASQTRYDLVVTDLRMPEANGHQLAVELLGAPSRPAIIILTGVAEPKLASDLRIRGVDEILFKPVEYDDLAKKARCIVERRALTECQSSSAIPVAEAATASTASNGSPPATASPDCPVAICSESQSTTAPDVRLTVADVARAAELDPGFAAEIAQFAKQKFPNPIQPPKNSQQAAMAAQRMASIGAVCTFAAGVVVGWTLSWLGLALFR